MKPATRLVCFGGQKDGVEIGVLDHEQEIKLATFRQREAVIDTPQGKATFAENYRVRLIYRRGTSPRSGKQCLVFVREERE